MKNAEPLSSQQKKAKAHFELASIPSLLLAFFVLGALWFAFFIVLDPIANHRGASNIAIVVPFALILGRLWTLRSVRRAGLSLESKTSQTWKKTALDSFGDPVRWNPERTPLGRVGYVLTPFLLGIGCWWMWRFADDPIVRGIAVVYFLVAIYVGVLGLFFFHSPQIEIDGTGLQGFVNPWRSRILWQDVAEYDVVLKTNYLGQLESRSFIFRDGRGKVLLHLGPARLRGLSYEAVQQIGWEIDRRLTVGETLAGRSW